MIGERRVGEYEKEKRRRRLLLLLLLLLLIPAAVGGGLVANLLRGPAVCSQSTPSVSQSASPAPSASAIQSVGGVEETGIPTPTPTPISSAAASGDGGAQIGSAEFTITGSVGSLRPGLATAIPVRLTNPNGVPIYVTNLIVKIAADSTPPGCSSVSNIQLTQSNVSNADPITVPAGGSVTLTSAPRAPRIVLLNLTGVNQDACKNKTFTLTFSGSART